MARFGPINDRWKLVALLLVVSLLAGCSFDRGMLEGRSCLSNSDCPPGSVCGPTWSCDPLEEDGGLTDRQNDASDPPDLEPGDPDLDQMADADQDLGLDDDGDGAGDAVDSDMPGYQLLSGTITSGSGFMSSTSFRLQGSAGLPGMPSEQQMTSTHYRMQSGIASQTALNQ
jgi:hypothetical protein